MDLFEVPPQHATDTPARTRRLTSTAELDLMHLVLTANQEIPEHSAPGRIVVHCVEGAVQFTVDDTTHDLLPGRLLTVPPQQPHSLKAGSEGGSLLVTKLHPIE